MPKKSKIKSSAPGNAAPIKEEPSFYRCTRCGREFNKQRNNFPISQSPIYKANNGHLHVCRHCLEEMYEHYMEVLEDERMAIKRICLKFDIYWHEDIYNMINKKSTSHSRILTYISRSNLNQHSGKTYDNTIDEESLLLTSTRAVSGGQEDEEFIVTQEMLDFWGNGFLPSYYSELEKRWKYWCGDAKRDSESAMDVGEKAVIRQICMLEVNINRDSIAGRSTEKSVNVLNALLGSANLKPVQKKEGADGNLDSTPFGVWIRKIENTRPISEPDPEWRDVDGVAKYISIWFLGHLCKMLKINNTYSRLYEEEMAKLRVERPEYEGEDEEAIMEDIFSRADSSDLDGGDGDVK